MGSSRSRSSPDLDRARNVQLGMLPKIPSLSGLEIACSYRACDELGGDFYDFITVDPWRFGIVIADVSGHGTAAALLMAAAKKVLQICGRGSLSPVQTILEVNDSIRADIPPGMFFTVFYGIVDIRNMQMTFVSCGHNPPLLRRGGKIHDKWELKNAPPIGVLPSETLKESLNTCFVQLQGDDLLLLYTDGLPEAFDAERKMYGEERLGRVLLGTEGGSAQDAIERITADLDSFRGDTERSDDETVVAIRATPRLGRVEPLMPLTGVQSEAPTEPPGELIGREKELGVLARKLESGSARVLTITGPLGSGKSRVAARVVEMTRGRFAGGVHFADLQSAKNTSDVCRLVATSLGLATESELGLRIARSFQGAGDRVLLVLDNCEDCAEPVATCIKHWTTTCPQLSVLNTSRRPIDLDNESVHALKPLRTPRPSSGRLTPVKAQSFPSVQLFVNAARNVDAKFELTDQNANDIIEICERLDGLPQAIEMAAARIGSMSPEQILKRLDKRSDISSDRHKPLEDALESSFTLLSEKERQALILLSLFPDGFQMEVAVRILHEIPDTAPEDLLIGLVKHSMVYSDNPPELGGEKRFYLYHAVRKFSLDMLHDTPAERPTRERFEQALLAYIRVWWDKDNERSNRTARKRVDFELEGMLEIVEHSTDPNRRTWAIIMCVVHLFRLGEQDRAINLLRSAQQSLESDSEEWVWVRALDAKLRVRVAPENVLDLLEDLKGNIYQNYLIAVTRGVALGMLGRMEDAISVLTRAEKLVPRDSSKRARVKERIGAYQMALGQTTRAKETFEHALRLAREHDSPLMEALTLRALGMLYQNTNENEKALRYLKEAMRIAQSDGDRIFESAILGTLSLAFFNQGEYQQAEAVMLRALRFSREMGDWVTTVAHLNTLASMYTDRGKLDRALKITNKSYQLARELGVRRSEAYACSNMGSLLTRLGRLDEAQQYLQDASKNFDLIHDRVGKSSATAGLGEWHAARWKSTHKRENLRKAIEYFEEACRIRRESHLEPNLESELKLIELLVADGNRERAIDWAKKSVEFAESRTDEGTRARLNRARKLLDSLNISRTVKAPPAASDRKPRVPSGRNPATPSTRPKSRPGRAPKPRKRRNP